MASKSALRTQVRRLLGAMPPATLAAASTEIRGRVQSHPRWLSARIVALYSALPTEPDLAPLVSTPGKTVCLPRISGDTLAFHHCPSPAQLRPGPWALLEPDPALCTSVPAGQINLLLIPGLAFTRTGARLGRGRGFYDRFLALTDPKATKIGICFDLQLLETLPTEIHDHQLDYLITESQTIMCG
jgi:5-formyltetrahydrofolate cyclo-ligase